MNTIYCALVLLAVTATAWSESPAVDGSIAADINKEIVTKKIDLKGWKAKGSELKNLKIGMTRKNVVKILGKPDPYPENQKDFCQYSPTPFNGGEHGPDWSLLIYFNDDKITGFEFRKWLYGPPPR
jgi:outer membrane protein assembly factor BamE (lipoprotein component of BamABCDE complex)